MKYFCFLGIALLASAAPAFSNVIVNSPANATQVVSPFGLSASATPCSSQPTTAMGYSLDNSTATTIVNGTLVNASVAAPLGAHTLHVKSWGNLGASCVTNVAITVISSPAAIVPPTAVAVKGIQALKTWRAINDSGATGTSSGTTALLSSPSMSGTARQFVTTYTNSGDERYYVVFGADTQATNFLYDGWVYLADPSSDIANLEMDMNQVMANGQTVIYGVQCDGYTRTWDYTVNAGTPQNFSDQWLHSTAPCDMRTWATNAWHHIQVTYSRDSVGNVTYQSIWLDGARQDLNVTAPSAFALGWGSALLTNFQIDGLGGYGSATTYLDNLTVYRW